MRTTLLSASVLGFGLLVSATIIANGAFAQTAEDSIQFPVAELGNCGDKDACKAYCDDASHLEACLSFAEKNNLMSRDEIDTAKKFMEAGGEGPGGCTGKEECQDYCDDINHIDACIAFAEKAGILPPEELAEAKQVQAAIAKGAKPPACRGKKECDAYCEDPSHMKECISFGEASGFLKGRELDDAKKMLTAIDNGAVPPPCRGKDACDAYCSEPEHMEACMTFAQAAGFMTEEEAQNSQKMLQALKKGVKPPQCRGKEECDAYCTEPAHSDECINFAIAAGFMSEKEAEMAKRTGGKGPGGCTGKDACEAFCGNPDNQQTCFDFAKENGMISEEDIAKMRQGPPPGEERREQERMMPPEGQQWQQPPEGQVPPEGQWSPEGRQMMPPEGQQWQQPPEGERPPGEQFAPGTYPNQGPPPGEGTSGMYQQQQQGQQMPPPEMGGGGSGGGWIAPTEPVPLAPSPEPMLQAQPIEQTAPQSSNFDLNSSLAAVITAFREFKF